MEYKKYRAIVDRPYNAANGNGTDQSVDPGPKRNPNNFLAPVFGNEFVKTAAIVAVVLVLVYISVVSYKGILSRLKVPSL